MGQVKGKNGYFQFSPNSCSPSDVTADHCFFYPFYLIYKLKQSHFLLKNGLNKSVTSSQTIIYAICKSKANYCKKLLTETSHKPKDFWKSIKKFFPTKQKSDLPPMMITDGKKRLINKLLLIPFVCFSPQSEARFRTR